MKPFIRLPLAALSVVALMLGATACDRTPPSGDTAGKGGTPLVHVQPGTGVIRGRVTFTGTPPTMRDIPNQPCHAGAGPLKEESVVVNADGSLRNVFVYLKGVTSDPQPAGTVEPPLLDQVNCQYVPHVVAFEAGRPLRVRSSDPTVHNVHFTPTANQADNLNMTRPGDTRTVTFDKPEFIRFKCDVHPWMSAYVGVFPSRYFATTADGGAFEITQLPAGTYTLAAWHERFGELEQSVTIDPAKPLDVMFNFAP